MQTVGIIPARLASTRLPRKLLLAETGKPLLQYVWEAARESEELDEVIIATDSPEIAIVAAKFGAQCELTGEHSSGSDRVAEVVSRCAADAEIVVNIQGDEPEIEPTHVDRLVRELIDHPHAEMATLATPITEIAERDDPACVKVVCAADGRALYFSRAAIPFCRDIVPDGFWADSFAERGAQSPWLLHIGLYAYRREFLLELTGRPPSRLEQLEKLEQLRALEAGATIQVASVDHRAVGIDTPDDYARFVARQRAA